MPLDLRRNPDSALVRFERIKGLPETVPDLGRFNLRGHLVPRLRYRFPRRIVRIIEDGALERDGLLPSPQIVVYLVPDGLVDVRGHVLDTVHDVRLFEQFGHQIAY